MDIKNWCEQNNLKYDLIRDNFLKINDKLFQIIQPKFVGSELKLFDDDFYFIFDEKDTVDFNLHNPNYFLFSFGNNFYYSGIEKLEFNIFKYIGNINGEVFDFPYIGIHSGYELCNAVGLYDDYIKKALFLEYSTLGICEKNTLSGSLSFQTKCANNNIKSIIGETVTVKDGYKFYDLKLYVLDQQGWINLLNINSQILTKTTVEKYVDKDFLLERSKGLFCVLSTSISLTKEFVNEFKSKFKNNLYYQFDFSSYLSNDIDEKKLLNIKNYIDNFSKSIEPLLIYDTYYVDKEYHHVKQILNKIGKIPSDYQSDDQYMKSFDEIFSQVESLFSSNNFHIFEKSIENLITINEKYDFKIETSKLHLPSYEMNIDEEKSFDTNEKLFLHLIDEGFNQKIKSKVSDESIYFERIKSEIETIKKGGFVDYFLILYDIMRFCKENDILTGPGRGSAAGSLISYLLDITRLDPIVFNLLFERFLNEARLKSLPDIDVDFESEKRHLVKEYIQNKYTIDNVCSIGTSINLKIKSAIKDIGRELGIDFKKTNYITSLIPDEFDDGTFIDLFKLCNIEPKIKEFVQENQELVDILRLVLFQPKTWSIHAAAVVVTPKYKDKNKIYDIMPVRLSDNILVSEWDKNDVEKSGFLKEDILGLTQLDKLSKIVKLIKLNYDQDIDVFNIPLDDNTVFDYFKNGLTEDIFQFNTRIQKNYLIALKPDNIEDLVAANALNRPGPMDSDAHNDFVRIKHGIKETKFDYLLEEITKDTYGLYCYQEQVMKAFQVIVDSTLSEADKFRKIITKTKSGKLDDDDYNTYHKIFVDAYVKKGCALKQAEEVWDKLIAFAQYAFNKSHAAAYSVLGYYSMWFKVYYPLEFYTVSLQLSKDETVSSKLFEVEQLGTIKIIAPDINNSIIGFKCDKETNYIYWSIDSIHSIGEVAVNALINERDKNGKFYSFNEFYSRVSKSKLKINRRNIHFLIICGCFDDIENIKNVKDRILLLFRFYNDILKIEVPDEFKSIEAHKDYFWQLKSKEYCGFGFINYDAIIKNLKSQLRYISGIDIINHPIDELKSLGDVIVAGSIISIVEKTGKNGVYARMILDNNNSHINVVLWNEVYIEYRDQLKTGLIIALNGKLSFNKWFKSVMLDSTNSTFINII